MVLESARRPLVSSSLLRSKKDCKTISNYVPLCNFSFCSRAALASAAKSAIDYLPNLSLFEFLVACCKFAESKKTTNDYSKNLPYL